MSRFKGSSAWDHIHGFVQERRNSSALAMELRLSYTNPSIWKMVNISAWIQSNHHDIYEDQLIILNKSMKY